MRKFPLALAVLLAYSPSVSAAAFNDISGSANATAILYLQDNGMISGYADGSFRPDHSINRAELAKILVTGTGNNPSLDDYNNCFSDVHSEWFAPYVCFAKAKGWVAGYSDGTFKPSNSVNTAEALKMILNAQGVAILSDSSENVFSDVDTHAWYAPYVETAHARNLLQKTSGQLGVASFMTRGLVAESIYRARMMNLANASRFEGETTPAPVTQSSSSTAPELPVADVPKSKYNDGIYTMTGDYYSPGGRETIQISVKLENDIITDLAYKGFAEIGRSKIYQDRFGEDVRQLVVGKSIDSINLNVVNGSSLTPEGFMNALNKIKERAAA